MATPYSSPHWGQCTARDTYDCAGVGGQQKRMPYCNGRDTDCNIIGHESGLTADWFLAQDSLENRQNEEKQMTAVAVSLTGASSTPCKWDSINWDTIKAEVRRLQMRITKATSEGRHGRVKSLQWILTHSFHAKLLAVKRVVQNPGCKTPGVDKIIWKTPQQKMQAAQSLTSSFKFETH